jgi:hypothetical protein
MTGETSMLFATDGVMKIDERETVYDLINALSLKRKT